MYIVNPTPENRKKVAKELELFVNLLNSLIMHNSVIDCLMSLTSWLRSRDIFKRFWQIIGFVCREIEFGQTMMWDFELGFSCTSINNHANGYRVSSMGL